MKYMGSKSRIAKHILPFILQDIQPEQTFVELFCGGCNLTDKIKHPIIIANDVNTPLIALWKELQKGWVPPQWTTKEEYTDIRENQYLYPDYLVGWACFCCSYSGKPFSGFAGKHLPDTGVWRDYQLETYNYILKQINHLMSVTFLNDSYYNIPLPPKSRVYCDPPYKGTTGYKIKFDHELFYNYVRTEVSNQHEFFISEYAMPDDFICIWQGNLKSSLSANGLYGGSKTTVEKLFVHKTQINLLY